MTKESECQRQYCEYLHDTGHVTIANGDDKTYNCISCNNTWKDKTCVVNHVIKGIQVNFCLNCDDWVQQKERIFDQGWSLVDNNGYLRRDV